MPGIPKPYPPIIHGDDAPPANNMRTQMRNQDEDFDRSHRSPLDFSPDEFNHPTTKKSSAHHSSSLQNGPAAPVLHHVIPPKSPHDESFFPTYSIPSLDANPLLQQPVSPLNFPTSVAVVVIRINMAL
ncbi:hypothetical protein FQN57_001814 [Myotisia sp. PD_48]|nr:hypothetical protein FQN57_001814 [Myotisia sp. PD_48]